MPCYLGIPLAVAYLLATQTSPQTWQQKIWQLVLLVIITVAFCPVLSVLKQNFGGIKVLINTDITPSSSIVNSASQPS